MVIKYIMFNMFDIRIHYVMQLCITYFVIISTVIQTFLTEQIKSPKWPPIYSYYALYILSSYDSMIECIKTKILNKLWFIHFKYIYV